MDQFVGAEVVGETVGSKVFARKPLTQVSFVNAWRAKAPCLTVAITKPPTVSSKAPACAAAAHRGDVSE